MLVAVLNGRLIMRWRTRLAAVIALVAVAVLVGQVLWYDLEPAVDAITSTN